MVKRIFLLIGMMIFWVLFAHPSVWAQETPAIKYGWRLSPLDILIRDTPIMKKYGVTVEMREFMSGIDLREGMISGMVDAGTLGTTITSVILSKSKNVMIASTCWYGGGLYRFMVRRDSPYKKIDELVGKKVAVQIGTGSYTAFEKYIKSRGWNMKAFQILNTDPPNSVAALQQGSIDGWIGWEPEVSIAEVKGIAREIFNFRGIINNPVFLGVTKKMAQENPEILIRFLMGFSEALEFLSTKPSEAADIVLSVMEKRGQKGDKKVWMNAITALSYEARLRDDLVEDLKEDYRGLLADGKVKGPEPLWEEVIIKKYIEEALARRKK